jgi:acyl dehydratase
LTGRELGVSEWVQITQERVNAFADATEDHQWIHVDRERAAEGPFGGTIAHGYLTAALLPWLTSQIFRVEAKMAINYGLNKLRFPAPVRVGAEIRARSVLTDVTEVGEALQVVITTAVEVQGQEKPALVAQTVGRYYL